MTEKLRDLSGGRILDVATSHGDFLKLLTDSFRGYEDAIGIDSAGDRIEKAREVLGDKLTFEVMDAEKMAFDDESFDTVAIRHSLHHLRNVESVLNEMIRVLKPGGLFILCEVLQDPTATRENSLMHLHHWWAEVDRWLGKCHNDTFTREEIIRSAEGLQLNGVETFEYLEETSESESRKILQSMLNLSHEVLDDLRGHERSDELIQKGVELIDRFTEQGFIDDRSLYLLGRK